MLSKINLKSNNRNETINTIFMQFFEIFLTQLLI